MWKDLTIKEKAAMMKVAVNNGIYDLEEIRNKYDEGGPINQEESKLSETIYRDERGKYRLYRNKHKIYITNRPIEETKEYKEKRIKEIEKREQKIKRDIDVFQGGLNAEGNSILNGNAIQEAANKQEESKMSKWTDYKKGINATMTAAELLSAGYILGGAAKAHNLLPNTRIINGLYASDRGQIVANTIGGVADGYQLLTDDSIISKLENGTETIFNTAGALGGTNVVRNSRLFGRYSNTIDNILDRAGITASVYDLGKGVYNFYNWLNSTKDIKE